MTIDLFLFQNILKGYNLLAQLRQVIFITAGVYSNLKK